MVRNWLHKNQIPTVRVDCTPDTGRSDLICGVEILPGGETFLSLGAIPRVLDLSMRGDGPIALWLEELSTLNPEEQKHLLGLMDTRCSVAIQRVGKVIRGDPRRIRIIATANPPSYGGTSPINAELRSRFASMYVGWPEEAHEAAVLRAGCSEASGASAVLSAYPKLPEQLVGIAKITRSADWGGGFAEPITTRELLHVLRAATHPHIGLATGLRALYDIYLSAGLPDLAKQINQQINKVFNVDVTREVAPPKPPPAKQPEQPTPSRGAQPSAPADNTARADRSGSLQGIDVDDLFDFAKGTDG
jgi:MoxR-like ATPase